MQEEVIKYGSKEFYEVKEAWERKDRDEHIRQEHFEKLLKESLERNHELYESLADESNYPPSKLYYNR